jgi:hypothetical protein
MSIWSSELGGVFVCGAILVAGLTLMFGGVASAHVADRYGRLETRRLGGWHVVRGRDRHERVLHGRLAHHERGSGMARVAIVGGSPVSIEQAPWQVALRAEVPDGKEYVLEELCGGAILNETHVLTAGHCMFDSTGARVPAEDFVVVAGSSDLADEEPTEEDVLVRGIRVHPYYSYKPTSTRSLPDEDDVAVVELSKPLSFTPAVQSIALASEGSLTQEDTTVSLTGFGEQSVTPEELNGGLYSIGMTLAFSTSCGGEADALFLCASTPAGSLCSGDSGGGLIIPGSTPSLIGVTDTVQVISGEPCRDGALGGFANIAAPEIQDFIDGDESPPKAPRGGAGIKLTSLLSPPVAGESLTCSAGEWSGEPTFIYSFISSASGQVLQSSSSPVYQLTTADDGLTILCQVEATNAGGTGVQRTNTSQPVSAETQQAHERKLREEEQAKQQAQDEALAQAELEAVERENAQAEVQKTTPPRCVVPSLKGDTLTKARRALNKAHCRLGKVAQSRGRRNGKILVTHQQFPPRRQLSDGTRVGVTLGPAPTHKSHEQGRT